MKFDLHIHSCLSPCASLEMSPAEIVARAAAAGLGGIALTDHQSARNCPAMAECARRAGIACLYGLEVQTSEEVHTVALFDTVEQALELTEMVYTALPKRVNAPEVFGDQPVVTSGEHGLHSKMGEFEIFVPMAEISTHYIHNTKDLVGKQFEAVVTEYDKENKKIIASIKLLQEQVKEQCENLFWNSTFVNKVVTGKVKKIMPYGIFVDVDGVDCFCHISNLSYEKIDSPDKVVKEGETLQFKVIELDRENKKVALGLKQLQESPREKAFRETALGGTYSGEVIKLLAFGAIIKLENGATGLLHISNATENKQTKIYELVRVGDKVQVEVIDKDEDNQKLSFKLIS